MNRRVKDSIDGLNRLCNDTGLRLNLNTLQDIEGVYKDQGWLDWDEKLKLYILRK